MELVIGYLGFLISVYAVIANDVIQTLGTFIASNHKTKWYFLWFFAAGILTITVYYGWFSNYGYVTY